MKNIFLNTILIMTFFGCKQKAFDHTTTEVNPDSIYARVLNSKFVIDTSHDLPMDFQLINENVKENQFCQYIPDCSPNSPLTINPKTVLGDTIRSSQLSRFADYPTRGYDRTEVVAKFLENLPSSFSGFRTETTYSNINYGDVFYGDNLFFFEDKVNEHADYVSIDSQLSIYRGTSLKREFLRTGLDPRNESFIELDCQVTPTNIPLSIYEKYDLGYFNLNSNKIKAILHTKITQGHLILKADQNSTLDIGDVTETILEVSAPLDQFIVLGRPQILYKNRDIVLKSGKRILSSTYKMTELKTTSN